MDARELDALVAEKVMGESRWCPEDDDDVMCRCELGAKGTIHFRVPLPNFSTDIKAAWKLLEHLSADIRHQRPFLRLQDVIFSCQSEEEAARAICDAALQAVRDEKEGQG